MDAGRRQKPAERDEADGSQDRDAYDRAPRMAAKDEASRTIHGL
jgi:hypothetical protein